MTGTSSESRANCAQSQLRQGSIIVLLGLMMFSCGDEPNDDSPPEGISEIQVTEKTDDCFISNGGTVVYGDYLASVRLIAQSPCKHVDGLTIEEVPGVESVWFLDGIESVKQSLWIRKNPGLKTLSGLESLKRAEEIRIESNSSLKTLEGLNGLEEISTVEDPLVPPLTTSGLLEIYNNDELESLEGLENLKTATAVTISDCDNLRSIEALYQLESLKTLEVIDSPVPRCQIDELVSRLESEPEFLDIKRVGTGSCQ